MFDSEQGKQVTVEEVEALIIEQPNNKARLRGVCVNIFVVVSLLSLAHFNKLREVS